MTAKSCIITALGISIGTIIILVGLVLIAAFPLMGERFGVGTILNVLVIGPVVDICLALFEEPDALWIRVLLMLGGPVAIAIGSGFYIGAGLGPGPRDGLMTGLARRTLAGRPISTRAARTFVEIVVLAIGIALGGAIGIGTAAFAFGIGPLVQIFLPRLTVEGVVPARRGARAR